MRRAVKDNAAVRDAHHALCFLRDAVVVGDEHDGVALVIELLQKVEHLAARVRVERTGRFVRKDNGRVPGERSRDGNALLLAAGKLARQVFILALESYAVNLETGANPDMKAPDTMGMKHRVDRGVYVTYGSINVQPAEKTGFSEEDAQALKEALRTIFRNDATAARPDGSMEVVKLIWWEHNCPNGQYSSAKVHRSLHVVQSDDPNELPTVTVDMTGMKDLKYTPYDGEY